MEDYIEHFGVKGMKWGVRKKSKIGSDDFNRANTLRKKNPDSLSNKELQEVNNRMSLENSYRSNRANNINAGHKWVKGALIAAATGITVGTLTKYGNQGVNAAITTIGRKYVQGKLF